MSARPPLRRRVRAHAFDAAAHTLGRLPLGATARLARPFARAGLARAFGTTFADNVAATLPWFAEHAPGVAARLGDGVRFRREVADFSALQVAHWLRLSRGARPGDARGAWVDDLVRLDPSLEHLERALALGRGAIVVTGHIGNWELLCARLRRLGHDGAVVGRVRRNDPSHSWLVRMRAAYGIETLPQDGSPRAMLRVLGRGGILGLLTDLRARRVDHVTLPLLSVPVPTMTAAAAFARASRAPVVPLRCVQSADGSFLLSAEAPLELDPRRSRREASDALLRAQNRTFERWIAETPEQWAWHQGRFGATERGAGQPE